MVLPSEGVFAEAVLGQSNSAEEIDITRFWDWNAWPIPILPPDMQPIDASSRFQQTGTKDDDLGASLAQLPALQGSELGAIMAAVQAGNMFRNMSGIEQTTALATALGDSASRGATEAAKTALEAQEAYTKAIVDLANSEAGKAAMQMAMTAVPGGKAATVMGGLVNAGKAKQ